VLRFSLSALVLFFVFDATTSADWLFSPRLTGLSLYTDNLTLAPPGSEENDFVFQLNPGFGLQHTSSRLNAIIDYNMQNLFYINNSEFNTTNHQLQGDSTLEIWNDNFFLDMNGSINQAIISAQNDIGADSISVTDNLTDVYTFGVSPYWIDDFGGYANFLARFNYGIVRYGQDAVDNQIIGDSQNISDSNIQTTSIDLASGRRFTSLNWQLNFFKQTSDQTETNSTQSGDSDNDDRESLLGTISYDLHNAFSINARAGYENNNVNDSLSSENGNFWSVGFTWKPSRFLSTSLFYGPDDQEIIVQISPTARTSLLVSRRDRSVGLDTGVVWGGTFEHRTRNSIWSASYTDSTVNGNSLLFDNQIVTCSSTSENSIVADNLGLTPVFDSGLTLDSGNFRRKRFQGSVTYTRARTNLALNGYVEKRDFSSGNEQAYGVGAAWSRGFGPHTTLLTSTCWQYNESNVDQTTDFWTFQTALTHVFTNQFSGALGYRYAQQNSSDNVFDYQENRIFLLLQLQF
jgi:uncharacterized protein (PEP-CTERM system associated)